jgi:Glu-tRNA(Gln) amidotransferase subunit E-like FAD-binding protein
MQIKSGIEIHQQLETHKLFCNCPSILRKDDPEFNIKRRLHAVAGESGEVDIAAKHEAEQDREFIYEGYDTTCLVELDEEPPHLINQEALMTVLHISILLNCEILSISQIMRKTVVDGSNTSGFQRTVLVARNGYIETKNGRVGIDNISLEEDSCRVINREEGKFRLDRLGIPLIEIGTAPDIKTPKQAKEVALYIGDVLRSCKVKRGIGTIRQDVNISIPGHPRIEIKGFQDVKMFIQTIEKEVKRQEKNLDKKDLVGEVRNALPDGSSEFLRPMPGAARMYPETDLPLLRITKQMIDEAKRTLPKLRSEIKIDLMRKGLRDEEIQILLKSNNLDDFTNLLKILNDPRLIYKTLIEIPKQIGEIDIDIIEDIIYAIKENRLDKIDIKHVMQEIVNGKTLEQSLEIEKADLGDVESEVAKIIKEKPGLSIGGYMGLIMQEFKGKINGQEANAILNKLLK